MMEVTEKSKSSYYSLIEVNFIALKIILKINKKKIKTDPGLIFTQGTLLVAYYIYARYEKNPRNSE